MPAKCCTAPEIPTAIYNSGATTLPVCPTCNSFGQQPASTAALEAPTAASPKAAARSSIILKFSLDLTPRPPETTMRAVVSSGLFELDSSSLINFVFNYAGMAGSAIFQTATESLLPVTSSKEVGLKVKNLISSAVLTLAKAFPAYVGLTKVFPSCILVGLYNNFGDITNWLAVIACGHSRNHVLTETG